MSIHKYHYFYKITNLINNKYYYGIHSTNDLNDGYMGSGKALKSAIKKYGIVNFKKDIIRFFDNLKDLSDFEKIVVNEDLLKDPNCYNLVKGGYFLSEEDIMKLKRSIKGLQSGSNNSGYGTCWIKKDDKSIRISKNEIDKYLDNGWTLGRNVKTTSKMMKANKNRTWIWKDGVSKYICKDELHTFLVNGWIVGRMNPSNKSKFTKKYDYKGQNLIILNKTTVLVKDKNGNKLRVQKDDPKYLSGELIPYNKGMVNAYDKNGNKFFISIDDPRYLSGELVSQSLYYMKGKVLVKDMNNNFSIVNNDDPRYINGELVPATTGRRRTNEEKDKISQSHKKRIKLLTEDQYIIKE